MADTGSAVLWVEGGATIVRGVVRRGGSARVIERQGLETFLQRTDWRIISASASAVAGQDVLVLEVEEVP